MERDKGKKTQWKNQRRKASWKERWMDGKTDSRKDKEQGISGRRIARYQDSKVPGKETPKEKRRKEGRRIAGKEGKTDENRMDQEKGNGKREWINKNESGSTNQESKLQLDL